MDFVREKRAPRVHEINIAGIDEPIYIRELSGAAYRDITELCAKEDGSEKSKFDQMALLVCFSNCDKDGNLLQTAADAGAILDAMTGKQLAEFAGKIWSVNDLSGDDAKKN